MKKLLIVAAGVAGYVLGSRAGRERYDQIRDQGQKVWNSPTVQSGVDHAADAAKHAASAAGSAAASAATSAAGAASAKVSEVVRGSGDDETVVEDLPDAPSGPDLGSPLQETPPVPPSPSVTTPPTAGDLAAESPEKP